MSNFKFGEKSEAVLKTCHPDLRKIYHRSLSYGVMDISCFNGIRTLEEQKQYFAEGKSKLDGVIKKSKHQGKEVPPETYEDDKDIGEYSFNAYGEPIISFAIDATPYPSDWSENPKAKARFYMLNGLLQAATQELLEEKEITHELRWGGDWDSDADFMDQKFDDLNHWELI